MVVSPARASEPAVRCRATGSPPFHVSRLTRVILRQSAADWSWRQRPLKLVRWGLPSPGRARSSGQRFGSTATTEPLPYRHVGGAARPRQPDRRHRRHVAGAVHQFGVTAVSDHAGIEGSPSSAHWRAHSPAHRRARKHQVSLVRACASRRVQASVVTTDRSVRAAVSDRFWRCWLGQWSPRSEACFREPNGPERCSGPAGHRCLSLIHNPSPRDA
jgi:hypothetical protein